MPAAAAEEQTFGSETESGWMMGNADATQNVANAKSDYILFPSFVFIYYITFFCIAKSLSKHRLSEGSPSNTISSI